MALIIGNALNNILIGDIAPADLTDDMFGEGGNDRLEGRTGDDNLYGGDGNDILDGGSGLDRMFGGNGNDTYVVDRPDDVVTEAAGVGSGIDLVQSRAANFTLSANVENVQLLGLQFQVGPGGVLQLLPAGLNATGNELANVMDGNSSANVLNGMAGNDTLRGYGGNDTLNGGLGNDLLDGGTGNDTMSGSIGNDTYIVDSTGDVVVEVPGFLGGVDVVQASVSHELAANVENLVLTGNGNLSGTGNTLNNTITGNSGSNWIDGGAGIDTMAGGLGNDTYIVDNVADTVSEGGGAGSGVDTVRASVTETLTDFDVENLVLTGVAAINGTGNANANAITGNLAANQLFGLGGNDSINGGFGNDIIQGGLGADTINGGAGNDVLRAVDNVFFFNDGAEDRFVFNTPLNAATNVDLIDKANFTQGGAEGTDDEIVLENGIFTALQAAGGGNLGTLSAGNYFEAQGTGNAFGAAVGIYNDTATGRLYYNPTFGIANDSVLFAVINNAGVAGGAAALSAEEFTLV